MYIIIICKQYCTGFFTVIYWCCGAINTLFTKTILHVLYCFTNLILCWISYFSISHIHIVIVIKLVFDPKKCKIKMVKQRKRQNIVNSTYSMQGLLVRVRKQQQSRDMYGSPQKMLEDGIYVMWSNKISRKSEILILRYSQRKYFLLFPFVLETL